MSVADGGGALRLAHGPHEAEVDPGYGGRVTLFRTREAAGWHDWFVPTPAGGRVLGISQSAGMYPLVPFSNRIRDARLSTGAGTVTLTANEPGRPHAIHGHGRDRAWTVEEAAPDRVVLTYAYDGGDWPWPYRAWQRFELSDDGLAATIIVENRAPARMPAGIGLHPFFPLGDEVRLEGRFETVWPAVADSIPTGPEPLPPELDFAGGRAVPRGLDTGFGGWDGDVRISWPESGRALRIRADGPFDHCIIFTPADRDFFCVEPVSHAIDGHNLAAAGVDGTGARWLAPGERLGGVAMFQPIVR